MRFEITIKAEDGNAVLTEDGQPLEGSFVVASQSELRAVLARVEALEARPEPVPFDPAPLQQSIFTLASETDAALAGLSDSVASSLGEVSARIADLENAPAPEPFDPTSIHERLAALEVGKRLIAVHGNGQASERYTSLPVTTGSPYQFRSVHSVRVTNIKKGDVLEFAAGFETECLHEYNTMIACYMTAASGPDDVTGIEVAEANGRNVFAHMPKYEPRDRLGLLTATQDYPELYFNLVLYAASTAAQPGHVMTVHNDYGRAYVKHFR